MSGSNGDQWAALNSQLPIARDRKELKNHPKYFRLFRYFRIFRTLFPSSPRFTALAFYFHRSYTHASFFGSDPII
jgi:hypothetical protein